MNVLTQHCTDSIDIQEAPKGSTKIPKHILQTYSDLSKYDFSNISEDLFVTVGTSLICLSRLEVQSLTMLNLIHYGMTSDCFLLYCWAFFLHIQKEKNEDSEQFDRSW